MKDIARRFIAVVASRTPEENARLLGVPVETLLEAMAPSTETMADFLATCPVINVAKAEAAEVERIGGTIETLTPAQRHEAFQREALRVLGPKPATTLHYELKIDTRAARAALAAVGDMRAALERATKATIAAREEQAALVASIRANGMVDAAWTSAEDAGLKALGDYLKGKPDAVQVSGHPDYPCHHWHTLTATRSELGQRRNEVASLKNTVAGRDAQIRKMEQRHVAAVFIERERTARVEVDLLGTINAITRQRDAADQQVAQAHRDRDDQWARADRSEAARAEAVRELEALRNR